MEIVPDKALVVRGCKNRPEDILRGTGLHPSGVVGILVECAVGISVSDEIFDIANVANTILS